MTGICGWTNWRSQQGGDRELLARMARGLGTPGMAEGVAPRLHLENDHGIAVWGARGDADIYADDEISVAYCGEVHLDSSADPGPAAALAIAYRTHGPDFLKRIRGPAAIVLFDRTRRRTLLAIDRIGIQGLYYAHRDSALVFGTTAGAVIVHPLAGQEIDPQGVFDYLHSHVVPAPRTIYEGTRKLLPAQRVIEEDGKLDERFYWKLAYEDRAAVPQAELAKELRELLRKVVGRAVSDENTGTFLSGGTDSSTVTGVLAEISEDPVHSYSIGFDASEYDETFYARVAAKRFETVHHEYFVTPEDVARAVPLVSQAYDEPFGNASAVAVYFCARNAKDHGTSTLLAGDGGDEIFAGNARYAKQQVFELYGRVPRPLRSGLERLILGTPGLGSVPPYRKLRSYIEQARIPLPDRLESYNFLVRNEPHEVFSQDFLQMVDTEEPLRLLREAYRRTDSDSSTNRMMHLDLKATLADNDLRKVNRMCELAGVRVRYPLLDEEMVEFSGRVPAQWKLRRQKLRYFFKESLKDFLPLETLAKEKHGFGLPFGVWLTNSRGLRELTQESLSSLRTRGWFNPDYIDELTRLHQSSDSGYYGVMIWVLIMLENWLQNHGKRSKS